MCQFFERFVLRLCSGLTIDPCAGLCGPAARTDHCWSDRCCNVACVNSKGRYNDNRLNDDNLDRDDSSPRTSTGSRHYFFSWIFTPKIPRHKLKHCRSMRNHCHPQLRDSNCWVATGVGNKARQLTSQSEIQRLRETWIGVEAVVRACDDGPDNQQFILRTTR